MFKLVLWLLIIFTIEIVMFCVGLGALSLLLPIALFSWGMWAFLPDDEWFN